MLRRQLLPIGGNRVISNRWQTTRCHRWDHDCRCHRNTNSSINIGHQWRPFSSNNSALEVVVSMVTHIMVWLVLRDRDHQVASICLRCIRLMHRICMVLTDRMYNHHHRMPNRSVS